MRTLINYIRSWFCKHEWELIFDTEVVLTSHGIPCGGSFREKTYRCTHCGMQKKYKSNKGVE